MEVEAAVTAHAINASQRSSPSHPWPLFSSTFSLPKNNEGSFRSTALHFQHPSSLRAGLYKRFAAVFEQETTDYCRSIISAPSTGAAAALLAPAEYTGLFRGLRFSGGRANLRRPSTSARRSARVADCSWRFREFLELEPLGVESFTAEERNSYSCPALRIFLKNEERSKVSLALRESRRSPLPSWLRDERRLPDIHSHRV